MWQVGVVRLRMIAGQPIIRIRGYVCDEKLMQTAIVAEGGGQRGIYTAGVLDAFLRADFNPFTHGVGVSAGAQNLLAYFLGQTGYARWAIAELTSAPDFFVPYRWFGSRSVVDLDGYFERAMNDPDNRLPFQRYGDLVADRDLSFVATDRDTLQAVYLEPDASTALDWMKASSAVPFLYRSGVVHEGRCLVDGGVSDPLPVRHAYEKGARRMLVVRTAGAGVGSHVSHGWRQRLERVGRARALPQTVRRMLGCYEAAIADAEQFLANPPTDLELVQVRPRSALCSQLFGSRSESLVADYRIGMADGKRMLATLDSWVSEVPRPVPHKPSVQDATEPRFRSATDQRRERRSA